MQRRELLEKLAQVALAAGVLTPGSLAFAGPHEPSPDGSINSANKLERALRRLAERDSSEQSVPMLLALENLAADPGAPTYTPGPINADLTAQFERYADLLLEIKSNPEESDAVALIVLMAAQELMPGRFETC